MDYHVELKRARDKLADLYSMLDVLEVDVYEMKEKIAFQVDYIKELKGEREKENKLFKFNDAAKRCIEVGHCAYRKWSDDEKDELCTLKRGCVVKERKHYKKITMLLK
jgi:hypothetical protein